MLDRAPIATRSTHDMAFDGRTTHVACPDGLLFRRQGPEAAQEIAKCYRSGVALVALDDTRAYLLGAEGAPSPGVFYRIDGGAWVRLVQATTIPAATTSVVYFCSRQSGVPDRVYGPDEPWMNAQVRVGDTGTRVVSPRDAFFYTDTHDSELCVLPANMEGETAWNKHAIRCRVIAPDGSPSVRVTSGDADEGEDGGDDGTCTVHVSAKILGPGDIVPYISPSTPPRRCEHLVLSLDPSMMLASRQSVSVIAFLKGVRAAVCAKSLTLPSFSLERDIHGLLETVCPVVRLEFQRDVGAVDGVRMLPLFHTTDLTLLDMPVGVDVVHMLHFARHSVECLTLAVSPDAALETRTIVLPPMPRLRVLRLLGTTLGSFDPAEFPALRTVFVALDGLTGGAGASLATKAGAGGGGISPPEPASIGDIVSPLSYQWIVDSNATRAEVLCLDGALPSFGFTAGGVAAFASLRADTKKLCTVKLGTTFFGHSALVPLVSPTLFTAPDGISADEWFAIVNGNRGAASAIKSVVPQFTRVLLDFVRRAFAIRLCGAMDTRGTSAVGTALSILRLLYAREEEEAAIAEKRRHTTPASADSAWGSVDRGDAPSPPV